MKIQIAIFIFSISVMAHAEKVDYKFCQQVIQKAAADNKINWVFKNLFSSTSVDSFKFEEVKGFDSDPNSGATFKPTVEDNRLTSVAVMFKQGCDEKEWKKGCNDTKLIFKVDSQANPCQFQSINLEQRKKSGLERRPVMAQNICQAIKEYRKKNPTSDFTTFYLDNHGAGEAASNVTWTEKFGLTYSLSATGSEKRLGMLEDQCQKYSPSDISAAAPATGAGQVPVAPKTQPAAK